MKSLKSKKVLASSFYKIALAKSLYRGLKDKASIGLFQRIIENLKTISEKEAENLLNSRYLESYYRDMNSKATTYAALEFIFPHLVVVGNSGSSTVVRPTFKTFPLQKIFYSDLETTDFSRLVYFIFFFPRFYTPENLSFVEIIWVNILTNEVSLKHKDNSYTIISVGDLKEMVIKGDLSWQSLMQKIPVGTEVEVEVEVEAQN